MYIRTILIGHYGKKTGSWEGSVTRGDILKYLEKECGVDMIKTLSMCMKLLKKKDLRLYYFLDCLHTLYKLVFGILGWLVLSCPTNMIKCIFWVIAKSLQFMCETRSPLESEHISVVGRVYKTSRQCLGISILRLNNFESLNALSHRSHFEKYLGQDKDHTDPLSDPLSISIILAISIFHDFSLYL